MRVIHIAAHVGGGVGSVLVDLFRYSQEHGVDNCLLCLDKIRDRRVVKFAREHFDNCWSWTSDEINDKVSTCEALILHFWNHPLTTLALHSWNFRNWPTIIWAHNSGLNEPHIIPSYLGKMASRILFSSSCSFQIPNKDELMSGNPSKLGVIHSSRSLDEYLTIDLKPIKPGRKTRLLYAGTVSTEKMHEHSATIFLELVKSGYSVRVVGGSNETLMRAQCENLGADIEFTGHVEYIRPHLDWADVFIYPLRSGHYGTGEQVMLEAMAAGLPIIAFDNPAERAIILNGLTGMLVESQGDFVDAVISVTTDQLQYRHMAEKSRMRAQEKFGTERVFSALMENIRNAQVVGSAPINVDNFNPLDEGLFLFARNSFHDEFLHTQAEKGTPESVNRLFEIISVKILHGSDRSVWMSPSKSSPFHYLRYFPESKGLLRLCELIRAKTLHCPCSIGLI